MSLSWYVLPVSGMARQILPKFQNKIHRYLCMLKCVCCNALGKHECGSLCVRGASCAGYPCKMDARPCSHFWPKPFLTPQIVCIGLLWCQKSCMGQLQLMRFEWPKLSRLGLQISTSCVTSLHKCGHFG